MKAFASWSGGKDCMLAVYRLLQKNEMEISSLVHMCDACGTKSRSHGIHKNSIAQQAAAMNIPILQKPVDETGYEACFKSQVQILKKQGVTAGVFGDIYLQEHRVWIERVCADLGITAVFPLW